MTKKLSIVMAFAAGLSLTSCDKDDNLDTSIITDTELNLKQFLYRPMQTFSKEDKVKLAESVNKYLKGAKKKEKMNAYNTIKSMIEIIWTNLYEKYKKTAKSHNSEENSEDDDAKNKNVD